MKARDPVCGIEVDKLRARAVAIIDGRTHYFCSLEHKIEFMKAKQHASTSEPTAPPTLPMAKPLTALPQQDPTMVSRSNRRSPVWLFLLAFVAAVIAFWLTWSYRRG